MCKSAPLFCALLLSLSARRAWIEIVEFHLYDSGIDFAEDWLDAGGLPRDEDGVYLVDDIDYIIDYVNDAINGRNPDFEGKLNADLWVL